MARTRSIGDIYTQTERIIGSPRGRQAIDIARTYIRNIDRYNMRKYGVSTGSTPSLMTAKYPRSVYMGLNNG